MTFRMLWLGMGGMEAGVRRGDNPVATLKKRQSHKRAHKLDKEWRIYIKSNRETVKR